MFLPGLTDGVGHVVESVGPECGVCVKGHGGGGVSELLLQGFDIGAVGDGDARARVSKS